jgi:hypothetical protein
MARGAAAKVEAPQTKASTKASTKVKSKAEPTKSVPAKPKRTARKTTPSPETLTELGLERLIRLVLDETARNPTFKKLVTAAVAGLQGPEAVAALIDRRLTALERGQGYIDWQKQRTFAADLDAMLTTVVSELAALDPASALDRLLRFLGGADDVLGRADDSSGRIHGVYERAADAAAALIAALPAASAASVALGLVARLPQDGSGLVEGLMQDLVPRLPDEALAPLDAALTEATPAAARAGSAWDGMRGRLLRMRQALADRMGDVDRFIALETERLPEHPNRVLIAERLLAAGREREALDWVRRPQKRGTMLVTRDQLLSGRFDPAAIERDRAVLEIRILEALGETKAAQDLRWQTFKRTLDREMLRTYLAKLPDFEDDAALDRAFAVADAHPNRYAALTFFTLWPNPARAARLVAAHRDVWEGSHYEILAPAAEALEHSQPQAASELYRLLIDDILEQGRSAAYSHAARYLTALGHLADYIAPGSLEPDPEAYREGLRRQHGRKSAFWAQVRD